MYHRTSLSFEPLPKVGNYKQFVKVLKEAVRKGIPRRFLRECIPINEHQGIGQDMETKL